MVFNKIKKLFAPKKVYDGDKLLTRDISYGLTIFKAGKRDRNFDEIVDKFLDELSDRELINREEFSQVKEKMITEFQDSVSFLIDFPQLAPERVKQSYDLIKKDIQLIIARNKKYDGIHLFGHMDYALREDEKQIPIDARKILLELNQQIHGIKINLYENKEIPKDKTIDLINKSFQENYVWEIYIQFFYFLRKIDSNFFENIKKLSTYLMKTKMLDKPLNIFDIKRRYDDAMEELIESSKNRGIKDFAKEIGKTVAEAGDIMADFTEKKIPKVYYFTLQLKRISPKKFMKMQEQLFKNLMIHDYDPNYEILFTTNADTCGIGYGCYVETRPDWIQQ